MRKAARQAVIGMVALLALAGCGGASGSDAPATGGGVAGSTGSGEILCPEGATETPTECATPAPAEGQLVTPSPGTLNARLVPFERFEAEDGSLVLTYTGGVESCYQLDRVEVSETAEEVTITIFEGVIPAAADQACIEIAVVKAVEVELSSPLGDRTVVDGADPG